MQWAESNAEIVPPEYEELYTGTHGPVNTILFALSGKITTYK